MKKVLLGNDAIVQGALEAGVGFVSGYPGCPSAEIGDGFGEIAKERGVYAEWSNNEKTALETAIGASFSGLKVLVNMKSFGLNVCSDSLLPLAYTGTKGPMVIFVGDDPSCHSSAQSEQDSRGYAYLAKMPVLEPSSPQECYDFTKLGFEISEKFNVPVILRVTTRVAHQRAIVEFTEARPVIQRGASFEANPYQFCTMPPRVLEMKKELLEKIEKIRAYAEKSKVNKIVGGRVSYNFGIVTTGVAYFHALEAMEILKLDLPVLKLGFFYPLPEKSIAKFIKGKKKVLVAEELDPHLENEIKRIAKDAGVKTEIHGKNLLSQVGELNTEKVLLAIARLANKKIKKLQVTGYKLQIPRRTARLCDGCPYWNVFPVLKRILPENTIFTGDIGCNMIAGLPPHNMQDTLFSMGASLGVAHGILKAEGPESQRRVVAIMGDGTFFHAGISGLINAVYNKSNVLLVVLDNRITAMTGHQQNPGMGKTLMGQDTQELEISEIAKACGVKNVKTLDPINMQELEGSVKDFLQKEDVSVIICKRICKLLEKRQSAEQHDQ